ncbi:MAG: DUF5606 domain-containing protein [Bacteroidota bacterium]|nr:DUF5606 domain-containing protein [Bacteroidota bacterium]MDP4205605.1 DUF5606 domain-containing protein [Bacteroidota bacterium]
MLKGILAISGQSGLFKLVSEAKGSIIVESLLTGKRMPAFSTAKISALEDIAVFTDSDEIPLKEVFKRIIEKENGGKTVDPKSGNDQVKAYFGEILPEYDRDRVYVSDMKKILQWYNLLMDKQLLSVEDEKAAEAEE